MTAYPDFTAIEQVYEEQATAEIAEIFADIRTTMSMSFVNLIWRRLALSPEGLRWTWQSMKPLYVSGAAYGEADALRAGLVLPPVPMLTETDLREAGIDASTESTLVATLDGYDRGNPLNTVAFSAILTRLDPSPKPKVDLPPAPPTAPGRRSAAAPASLLSVEDLPTETADLLRAVTRIGARGDGLQVQVSLPRNLAHWPGFLRHYQAALQPLHDDGRLFKAVDDVLAEGRLRGIRLADNLAAMPLPPSGDVRFVRETLALLVPHAMGRMIPVVSLLRAMLPRG